MGAQSLFAAHSLYRRGDEPVLVRSVEDAYRALAIGPPDFELLEADAAGRLEGVALGVLAAIDAKRGTAEAEKHERMRRKMLQLLDTVMKRPPPPADKPITLSDVLNAALSHATVSDADLKARCACCKKRRPLSRYRISAGRETTYACPSCGSVMVVLASADEGAAEPSPPGYEMGRFIVRTSGDIECPGAMLPKMRAMTARLTYN